RWSGVHSALATSPAGIAAKKLVLLSIVVVLAPSDRLAMVAIAPSVSANAMTAPPCSTGGRVHNSSRTGSSAFTQSGATLTTVSPISLENGNGSMLVPGYG